MPYPVHSDTAATVVVLALGGLLAAQGRAYGLVEASFDDSGTGGEVLNADGDVSSAWRPLRFLGQAHRSEIDQGRYGRAAVLGGGEDAVQLPQFYFPTPGLGLMVWLKPDDNTRGWILLGEKSLGLRLHHGEIQVAEYRPASKDYLYRGSGLTLPADGHFHHLMAFFDSSTRKVYLMVDFQGVATAVGPLTVQAPPTNQTPWSVGRGFVGLVDELLLGSKPPFDHTGRPTANAALDWMPEHCGGDDLRCVEQVFVMTPNGWMQPEPVRYKVIYDPSVCSPANPCPLLFKISGGGSCANDYVLSGDFARRGFVVATVDPFCEISASYGGFPTESSQLVEVKDRIFDRQRTPHIGDTPVLDLIAGSDYLATGGSHGGGAVSSWAFLEQDYPARTFAQSGGAFSYHCAYHYGGLCPRYMQQYDELLWGSHPHNDTDPRTYDIHRRIELIEQVDSAFVTSREFGASWGVDTSPETPVCKPNGDADCFEEGMAITYSSRRLRDAWQRAEPLDAPTGFFFENQNGDCVHGYSNAQQLDCVSCFLHHGRAAMASRCPQCLQLPAGGPAGACDIACTPTGGCVIGGHGDGGVGPDGGGHDSGVDAGGEQDGGVDLDGGRRDGGMDARGEDADGGNQAPPVQSGCSCRAAPSGSLSLAAMLLVALCLRLERGPRGRRRTRRV